MHKDNNHHGKPNGSATTPIRIWMDGSFDMLHAGHVRAMQQARLLGDCLVVGSQSDADVIAHKARPVCPEAERFRLIEAVKFVDEFVGAADYGTSVETLDKHNCAYCVHGDDNTLLTSPTDPVQLLINVNRAKLVDRGYAASTTVQITRILERADKFDRHQKLMENGQREQNTHNCLPEFQDEIWDTPTSLTMCAFSNGRAPQEGEKVVYVDGAFDLFNVGHLSFLEKAAMEGEFLLVGIRNDYTVAKRKGSGYPVVSMVDRAMVILSLKVVSDVIFGAPAYITNNFINNFKINVVCRGVHGDQSVDTTNDRDAYEVAKRVGIYKELYSDSDVTTQTIINRVLGRRSEYIERNKKKIEKQEIADKLLEAKE